MDLIVGWLSYPAAMTQLGSFHSPLLHKYQNTGLRIISTGIRHSGDGSLIIRVLSLSGQRNHTNWLERNMTY